MQNNLKVKLKKNEVTIGSWITLGNTSIAEIMAKSGFDWLAVDMEHSAITLREAQQLIQVIELCWVTPLVRVSVTNACLIKRVMDTGAHGVIVPMVNNKADAAKAVSAVKYPPVGTRGIGLARAQGYGLEFERHKDWVNANTIVAVQIEHIEAIDKLEEILEVEGVDASIIGPYDLSASLGHPGQFKRKEILNAVIKYKEACKRLGKAAGFHVILPEASKVKEKIKEDFRFIGFSLDTLFLGTSVKNNLKEIRCGLGNM